jgi:hypothetical protein
VTPAAMTPAARGRPAARASRATKPNAHPRPVRARVAPPTAPRVAPPAPRRISGPARPVRTQPAGLRGTPLRSRAVGFIRGLPDHALLDRLVRGRAWIPVLGVMLAGIVAMQVEVLKLSASTGRSIALVNSLQTRNELLRTSVSSLSDARRIERIAARMGMVMPGPASVDFLHGKLNATGAIAAIHVPDAAAFDSALQARSLQAAAATTPASTATQLGPTATPTATAAPSPTSVTSTATATATSTPTVSTGTGPTATGTSTATGAAAAGTAATTSTGATASSTGATATTPTHTSSTGPSGGATAGG